MLRSRILPRWGTVAVNNITYVDVQRWVAKFSSDLAPTTVHKCAQILSKTLAGAVRQRLIATNPCDGMRLPKVVRADVDALTPDDVARLADAIRPEYRGLVRPAAYGGLRFGELAALRWRDVNALKRQLHVRGTAYELNDGTVRLGPPKNGKTRIVPLPAAVVDEINASVTTPPDPDALAWSAPRGGPLRRSSFRRRTWLPATTAAGLGGLVSEHLVG